MHAGLPVRFAGKIPKILKDQSAPQRLELPGD